MCDVKKYYNIYDELKKLKPEDTLQLVMEAENDEEKQFFEMLGNYLLQEKQNKVIERNLFWSDDKSIGIIKLRIEIYGG